MKSKINFSFQIKYQLDYDKSVIIENFEDRSWQKAEDDEEDWNIYWANKNTIRNLFNPKYGIRLNDNQLINHFPNFYEISRKDLMVKNLKKYKKEFEKENNFSRNTNIDVDFWPKTYILPQEFNIFVDEFQKSSNKRWILKPSSQCQGKGITLINKINQVKNIILKNNKSINNSKQNYVICKYIDNPLLIGKKKFDIRMYILVTNFKPLKIWKYNKGFCRFCTENYPKTFDEKNLMAHLTNVAFQKNSDNYNDMHGGKYTLENFFFYIECLYGRKSLKKLISEIDNIFIQTCKSVQNVIYNDKHCFELYGFDILIDKNLKAWLIELNSSPSWTATTLVDKKLKKSLVNDIIDIVVPSNWKKNKEKIDKNDLKNKKLGNFINILDESTLDKYNKSTTTYYNKSTISNIAFNKKFNNNFKFK